MGEHREVWIIHVRVAGCRGRDIGQQQRGGPRRTGGPRDADDDLQGGAEQGNPVAVALPDQRAQLKPVAPVGDVEGLPVDPRTRVVGDRLM